MLIVGKKEVETKTVSVRSREDGDLGAKDVQEWKKEILSKIEKKV